jgi:hypothetical protein
MADVGAIQYAQEPKRFRCYGIENRNRIPTDGILLAMSTGDEHQPGTLRSMRGLVA